MHGMTIPCVSAEAQRRFRTGYELRDLDEHYLALLAELPAPSSPAGGGQSWR